MARFRSKDTRPEIVVRRALHAGGRRFRLHAKHLPGRPDIVLPKDRTIIMVHGCFWHAHSGCRIARVPATRSAFWEEKFRGNRARDQRNAEALSDLGWRVITIWECEALSPALNDLLAAYGLVSPQPR